MPRDSLPSSAALTARALLSWNRRRADLFAGSAGLFGDPAWQVLLDLYVQEAAGRRVSVTSACIAAGVPVTTALRWLGRLEVAGLIARTVDVGDGRRSFVSLTDEARAALERWLDGRPVLFGAPAEQPGADA